MGTVFSPYTNLNFTTSELTAHNYYVIKNGGVVPVNGKAILELIGTGAVPTIYIPSLASSSPSLNSGTALTSGAYYEMEVHVVANDTITISNATVGRIIVIEGA